MGFHPLPEFGCDCAAGFITGGPLSCFHPLQPQVQAIVPLPSRQGLTEDSIPSQLLIHLIISERHGCIRLVGPRHLAYCAPSACVGIRTTIIQAGFSIIYYHYTFILILKVIKTYSWAPKTIAGPPYCLRDKRAPLGAHTLLGVAAVNKTQCLSSWR